MSVFDLKASLACKLASIVVHSDEFLSSDGHIFDKIALQQLLADNEVQTWIQHMGNFAPVKRRRNEQTRG